MEKFLNVCFKIGKVLLSLLLVIILSSGLFFVYTTISSSLDMNNASNTKIIYTFPKEVVKEATQNYTASKSMTPEQRYISSLYKEKVQQALKNNRVDLKFTEKVLENLVEVEEQDRDAYVENLSDYIKDYTYSNVEYVSKLYPYLSKSEIKHLTLKEAYFIDFYQQQYQTQAKARNTKYESAKNMRNMQLWGLLGVMYMFIVALIIPILIRIEENTRK